LEQHSQQTQQSRKNLPQEKKQSGDGRLSVSTAQLTAASAAERAFGLSFPGVPGELLLEAGNQLLLRLSGEAVQSVNAPELSFSEESPANEYQPGETAPYQLPEFSGKLLGLTSLSDIGGDA